MAEDAEQNVVYAIETAANDGASKSNIAPLTVGVPEPQQVSPPVDGTNSCAQPLSKKAQKRLARAAFFQEKKLERRQREKSAKKERKRERRERAEVGDGSKAEDEDEQRVRKKPRRTGPIDPFKVRVVIDLGFDSYMSDKEIISLSSQLAYCYSANRHAARPFESVLFTSLNGRLRTRLETQNNAGYRRWSHCEWWEEGYERLWAEESPVESSAEGGAAAETKDKRPRSEQSSVVYLTADAEDELDELREGETYILGGIVDRNRHKFLCQKKAVASGIRSARLPIGKYLAEMKTRKVLTVNQVFEILIHWAESRDWEAAIYSVMPKRKYIPQAGKTAVENGNAASTVKLDEVEDADADADGDTSEGEEGEGNKHSIAEGVDLNED